MTDSTAPTEATAKSFANAVIEKSRETPVLVDFWADWCGPCHALSPILSDISYEMSDKIKIVKINVDKQDELSSRFNVESMPTMILFKNGQEFNRIVGVKDKEYIIETIQQTLSEQ